MNTGKARGFTLIELSIVLVIIGLIVGGILTGRSLIRASELSATVSQIQKYAATLNTFRTKYDNHLPGDMDCKVAPQYGLFQVTWSGHCGAGDNTLHDVANEDGMIYMGLNQAQTLGGGCGGECSIFWRHLSDAKMVDGNFGADLNFQGDPVTVDGSGNYVWSLYMPTAKYGSGNYIVIASMSFSGTYSTITSDNAFYFTTQGTATQNPFKPMMTPNDAYAIDSKIDDGKPTQGKVRMEVSAYSGTTGIKMFTNAAASGFCVAGVTNVFTPSTYAAGVYNIANPAYADVVSCIPDFIIK